MVSLPTDDVVMEMFCSANTWMELPLDHVHQVILGGGTPEALHKRVMGWDCNSAWSSGGSVMLGSAEEELEYICDKTNN